MFSSPLFDTVLFDFSLENHVMTYYLTTAIPYFITCCFLSVLNSEISDIFLYTYSTPLHWKHIVSRPASAVVLFAAGIVLAALPVFTFYSIASFPLKKYHWISLSFNIAYVTVSITTVDLLDLDLDKHFAHWIFPLVLCFLARALCIYCSDLPHRALCTEADIEIVRAALTEQFGSKEQMKKFINRARSINDTVGSDVLHSVLLDVLIGK
eukprot:TRINITY_DN10776_c0_g1_i4.p1 TRINITY_DN10776_c0_g1~~TRINITY_DN10776_c0_g1_i4.p1  ORF type:complete len:210 (-),score=46.38 TRINITY_DN10776_c0_g1_i4:891-1520(-)